ncbi:MAG: hypothetical protein EOP84_30690 [Verrucomicrobiaceae bacterium]|nr:MAG: hypothetical protein EOP84_30690 [Verrucomicrobiaceae bacterium]
MSKLSILDMDVAGKRVLVRADLPSDSYIVEHIDFEARRASPETGVRRTKEFQKGGSAQTSARRQ